MQATLPASLGVETHVNSALKPRILKTDAEFQAISEAWDRWQRHPHVDRNFFLTIAKIRQEVISPYVIALYRGEELETILVGRMERGHLPLSVGYWNLGRIPVRCLTVVYEGLLGSASDEHCAVLVREIRESMKRERAHLTSLHFIPVGSPIHRAAMHSGPIVCRDFFPESRPHWVMKLPGDISDIYEKMSPKARRNRRYEANRLLKEFPNAVRVECYSKTEELERVLEDAEAIARHTYQRGLGVGFVANDENRERFLVEAERGRFRAYFLYLRDKPVAFFIGTLNKNVLYDNFTAYDPDYSKHSPGMYLFFQIFERICKEGVEAVDFGFGDAWYKAHFGTEKREESTVALFAPRLEGIALNLLRLPVLMVDALGKKAVQKLNFLSSVKKKLRDRAQKRASSGETQDDSSPR